MLARAARRRLRRDAFRSPTQLCEQLTLPWLCPAQMRWTANVGPITANSNDSRRQRHVPSPSLSPRHETRSLATAADAQPSQLSMPFDGLMQPWPTHMQPASRARLERWDPSSPLVVNCETPLAPSLRMKYGIGGDPVEMHQNLHACLRVGRMDRATAIIERLRSLYDPSAPEVTIAHNHYLQKMVSLAQQNQTPEAMAEIEEWYDTQMVRLAIEPNADTFVSLLQASITLLDGQERTSAIQKYIAMAKDFGEDVIGAVNDSPEFSDAEFDILIRSQPERYNEPPPLENSEGLHISTPAGQASLIEHGLLPNPAHHIKGVDQKGYGLETLKRSLAVFQGSGSVEYPHEMEGTKEEKDRTYNYMRQLRLENDSTDAAVERWKAEDDKLQEMGIHGVLKTRPVQSLLWHWYTAILPLFKKEFALVKAVLSKPSKDNVHDDRHKYGPFLESCTPEKLAALTVSRAIRSCATGRRTDINPLKVAAIASALGEDVEEEVNLDTKRKHDVSLKRKRSRERTALLSTLARTPKSMENVSKPSRSVDANLDTFGRREFPASVKTRIGALAVEFLLQSATVTVTAEDPKTGKQLKSTQPAFHHHTGFTNGKRIGWISPHHVIVDKLRTEPVDGLLASRLPMVFEPKPWSSFEDGGYYTGKSAVVRTKSHDPSQRAYAHSAIENGDMDQVLRGLDVLGKVPWQINGDVFNVMAQAWNSGEAVADMVPEQFSTERPIEPPADAPIEERNKWLRKLKTYENERAGLHSQRCFQNFQLEIARSYVREKRIFFPHSIDFRGRAYPIPPLLNHIQADSARGLLKFANGKELGTVGLQWLKIHLANLYGYDKASLREREQFAMDHVSDIYDSATNPLNGRRWWLQAEDPWQCLACCMELKNALDSPDPTRFVSQLPIHQDGTCNGLQHYAALGGDSAGATQVNLEPSDRPQDIYTGVAELVKEMVAEDAAKGHTMALFVQDKITRKVVKRTVMTNVYGVTFIGAKLQVWDELKTIFPNFEESNEIRSLAQPALYIAVKIFAALGKIFNGAQEIQYWLGECGDRITTSISPEQIKKIQAHLEGKEATWDPKYKKPKQHSAAILNKVKKDMEFFKTSIVWTTPLRMPVVQPYRKNAVQTIKTNLQDITVSKLSSATPVDRRKQLQAFPPNFIHSLDATHMILSALKCNEMGLDFAAVHDSFWTHAADIPNLNVILRDAFVRMHSEDITSRLAAEFKARYAGSMYRATLTLMSPVGRKIAAWRWKHKLANPTSDVTSKSASFEELALEAKRQELLKSDDPAQKKEGEQMITPTSIWLANQDPSAMASFRLALLGEKSALPREGLKNKVLGAEIQATNDDLETPDTEHASMDEEMDEEMDAAALEEAEDDIAENEDQFETTIGGNIPLTSKRKYSQISRMHVWLPLTFPPVPKKGSWDVARLRESKYFFS